MATNDVLEECENLFSRVAKRKMIFALRRAHTFCIGYHYSFFEETLNMFTPEMNAETNPAIITGKTCDA